VGLSESQALAWPDVDEEQGQQRIAKARALIAEIDRWAESRMIAYLDAHGPDANFGDFRAAEQACRRQAMAEIAPPSVELGDKQRSAWPDDNSHYLQFEIAARFRFDKLYQQARLKAMAQQQASLESDAAQKRAAMESFAARLARPNTQMAAAVESLRGITRSQEAAAEALRRTASLSEVAQSLAPLASPTEAMRKQASMLQQAAIVDGIHSQVTKALALDAWKGLPRPRADTQVQESRLAAMLGGTERMAQLAAPVEEWARRSVAFLDSVKGLSLPRDMVMDAIFRDADKLPRPKGLSDLYPGPWRGSSLVVPRRAEHHGEVSAAAMGLRQTVLDVESAPMRDEEPENALNRTVLVTRAIEKVRSSWSMAPLLALVRDGVIDKHEFDELKGRLRQELQGLSLELSVPAADVLPVDGQLPDPKGAVGETVAPTAAGLDPGGQRKNGTINRQQEKDGDAYKAFVRGVDRDISYVGDLLEVNGYGEMLGGLSRRYDDKTLRKWLKEARPDIQLKRGRPRRA